MADVERYALLLKELGEAVRIPDLAADETGYAGLDIDGMLVQLQLNPHTGIVTLFTQLGKVPDEHRAAVNERLLDANLFWQGTRGATIGADIESHEIVIGKEADSASSRRRRPRRPGRQLPAHRRGLARLPCRPRRQPRGRRCLAFGRSARSLMMIWG